jgi:hypothetical protein
VTCAYCPHCALVLAEEAAFPFPHAAMRCRHCRLVVGPGRGRSEPLAAAGARGAAAGRYASEARRAAADAARGGAADATDDERDGMARAVRAVADDLGRRTGQVTLIDYQERAELRGDLPPLADVIAAFGTWKAALAAAGRLAPAPPAPTTA